MTKTLTAALTLLFTTAAWADEGQPAGATNAPATDVAAPAATPAPSPIPAPPSSPAAVETVVVAPSTPEPYTGWGRGVRAPIYVNLMLSAGAYGEDGGNRLTTRDSKLLEGFGGLFRIGAVLSPHHRLGGRLQSFVRPTKKVALDAGSTATPTNDWGAVTFGFAGPEYIYDTDFGVYGAASAGMGFAVSSRHLDDGSADHDHDVEKASAGLAGMLSLGYQWRASKWFAMNAEVFGGLYHGVDDNETSMDGALFGLGMGVGF